MQGQHSTNAQRRRGSHAVSGAFLGGLITVAVTLAGAAAATGPAPDSSIAPPVLPAPDTWSDRGVDSSLLDQDGMVRVRLILRNQPLLAAAAEPEAQERLRSGSSRGRGALVSPKRISGSEKAAALRAERTYEAAIETLQPAADEASAGVDRVIARVEATGGRLITSGVAPAAVVARLPASELERLDRLASVRAIEAAPRPRAQSSVGWQAIGAPSWHSAGFTGGTGPSDNVPADVGVSSEVPDATHPAFAGIDVDNYGGLTPDEHGTRTASIIASGDSTNRGVSYGADRLVNGATAFQLGFAVNGNPAPPDPAEVVNSSFGSQALTDNEEDGDDITTYLFGVSQAMGASNENVDGSPTVDNIGRNTMSVGGYNDVGTVTSTDDVVLGISGRGPTPGGRKKPDLTAPGGAVVAADIAWDTPPSNPDYTAQTGTSFSSPHVAGAMTLLEGAGITDAMAQRAILINSARDWNGTNTGLHGWTSGTQTGWRPEVGWGELDLTSALAQRGYYALGSVPEGEATFYRATVPAGSKATMAFQLRGYFIGYPDPGTQTFKYTVSNLDLHQYRSDDVEVSPPAAFDPPDTTIDPGPNALDPNDTIEQVRSPASPASQTVTYKVQSASSIDGAAAEPFAIAAAAPLTPLDSPTVRPMNLDVSAANVRCGQPVTLTTMATNDSPDLDAANAAVAVELPAGVSLVSGGATQTVSGGTLESSATSELRSWTVQATSEGTKTIVVRGAGDAYGTTFRDSAEIEISADCSPPDTSIDSGVSGPTNDSQPVFTFSASGSPTSFECSVDGTTFVGCSSPFATGALPDARHTFRVRAVDGVGNIDPTPAERAFEIDTEISGAKLAAKSTQSFRKQLKAVVARVGIGEDGVAKASATVRVRRSTVQLDAPSARISRGNEVSIRLVASRSGSRKITKALMRRRLKVDLRLVFSDGLQNESELTRRVTLR